MADNLPSNNNWNNDGNCYSISYPFFIDKHKTKIEKHHNDILTKIQDWRNIDFKLDKSASLVIDFDKFRAGKLKIKAVEMFNPSANKQKSKLETLEEMAVSHLKDYEDVYNYYLDIVKYQAKINLRVEIFLKENMKHLNEILGRKQSEKFMDESLRYYLIKIVMSSNSLGIDNIEFLKKSYYKIPLGGTDWIQNPFSEIDENIIVKDAIERKGLVIGSINSIKEDIKKLRVLIVEFQKSLEPIAANEVKGICSIEGIIGKIKYGFRRRHVP